MEVKLLTYTPLAEYICAKAAAMCRGKEPGPETLERAIKSGHLSVAEHASFTFEIRGISRVCMAQLTRHRMASFSVESQRAVRMTDLPSMCVVPESITRTGIDVRPILGELQRLYEMMVCAGVPREDARYILPEAASTSLVVTMNARELRHFFSLRCCNRAQWEIRQLADRMLELSRCAAPALFADAGAPCQCGMPCPEARPCGHPRSEEDNDQMALETL